MELKSDSPYPQQTSEECSNRTFMELKSEMVGTEKHVIQF